MLGDIEVIDFIVAEKTGKSLSEVRSMPNIEILEWACYFHVKSELENMHAKHEASKVKNA